MTACSSRLVFYAAAADASPSMIRWAFRALSPPDRPLVVAVAVMLAEQGDPAMADALEPEVGALRRPAWPRPQGPPRGVYR